MRWMGIDHGDARIGIALSDRLGITSQAFTVIDCRRVRDPVAQILDIVREEEVTGIVMGLPRHMNGTVGDRAEKARAFGEELREKTGLPVEFMDERLTTVSAHRVLSEGDVRGRKRREVVDKVAAALILQTYLESRGRS